MTNGAESEQTFFAQRIVIRPSRLLLNLIASLIALVAIWPLIILIAEAFGNLTSGSIDLGPDGGDRGGEILVTGTPEEVAQHSTSYTGQYLARVLNQHPPDVTVQLAA